MSRRKNPSEGKPRTGNGHTASGKKPPEVGIMQMRSADTASGSMYKHTQPRGWGIAKVVDIFTGKPKKNPNPRGK